MVNSAPKSPTLIVGGITELLKIAGITSKSVSCSCTGTARLYISQNPGMVILTNLNIYTNSTGDVLYLYDSSNSALLSTGTGTSRVTSKENPIYSQMTVLTV